MGGRKHRVLKRVLKWGGLLCLLGITAVGILWFAMRDQVISKVLDLVESRFAEDGLYMGRGSHSLSVTRGVVLSDLALFGDEAKQQQVALIEDIGIWIPVWDLLKKDAEITLSSNGGGLVLNSSAGSLRISDLEMNLRCTVDAVQIDKLNARLNGLRLELDGSFSLQSDSGSKPIEIPDLSPVVKGAECIGFSGGDPTLKVRVMSKPGGSGVDMGAEFSGRDFSWKEYEFEQVSCRMALRDRVIQVPEVVIEAYGGSLIAELEVDHVNQSIAIPKFETRGDSLAMVRAYAGADFLGEYDIPAGLELAGQEVRIDLKNPTESEGHLSWNSERGVSVRFEEREFDFTRLKGAVKYSKGILAMEQFEAQFSGLHVSATGELVPERLGGSESESSPGLSILGPLQDWLAFSGEVPRLAVEFHQDPDGGVSLKGALSGSGFKWKDIKIDRIDSSFVYAGESVEIPEFSADCYGGTIAGDLVVDYRKSALLAGNLTSSVDPFRLVGAIMGSDTLDRFRTLGPTVLKGKKIRFDLKKFSRSKGRFSVSSPAGLVFPVGRRSVGLRDFHGGLSFENGKLVVTGDRFVIYQGKGSGVYSMPLSGDFRYQLKVKASGLSLRDLGKSNGMKDELVGSLSGNFDGGGARGGRSFHGSSRVAISDGKFYSVPVLGALRSVLTTKSEEFGRDVANDLQGTLQVKNGVVSSSDLRIESPATTLFCKGEVDFMNKRVNGDVRANLKGIAGVATGIVSWVMTVHGEGPYDNVIWTMASPVADGVKSAGDVIKGAGDATGKFLEKGADFLFPKK